MRTAKQPKLTTVEGGLSEAGDSSAHELKYRAIFDQASDAIITVLPSGLIDAMNYALEELTGYHKEELVGHPAKLLVPNERGHVAHSRSRALTSEMLFSPGTYEDVAIMRKDGYIRIVEMSVRLISSGGATLAMALLRDVTEKKQMERELITKHTELRNAYFQLEKKNAEIQAAQDLLVQSGKMAALGELAAGIAHELNQPLQGIRGYAQELQALTLPALAKTAYEPEAAAGLREIISNVDKMASIIDYLRAFTRKSVENFEFTDIHARIEEALKMLARQFAVRGISVDRDFDKKVPEVYANPLQLEQIFINLATNARDAIEATGRGSGKVKISTRKDKEFVEVVFKDDGIGMNEKTKAKAFNPFFTTKEVGKGMGLGLSLSYGMMSKLHGSIVVESELGKGAAFVIRLPRDFRELA